MKISHRHLEQVVALNRHRHFGRAAADLSLSQPALSRSIQALEEQLGLKLFDRSRSGVAPTRGGRIVLDHAQHVLAASAALESDIKDHLEFRENALSLAVGLYPTDLSVTPAVSSLLQSRPRPLLKLEVVDWVSAYRLLEQGRVQLVLCERSGHECYASEPINQRPVYFAVRPEHPLFKRRTLGLNDLLAFPWASSRIPARAASQFDSTDVVAGRFDGDQGVFMPAISSASLPFALNLARQTDVIALAPLTVAEPYLKRRELALLPFSPPWLKLNYGFAWRAEHALSSLARRFMQQVRDIECSLAEREQALALEFGCDRFPS